MAKSLKIPGFFDAKKAEIVQKVDYEGIASQAKDWRIKNSVKSASTDKCKVALMIIDAQNTFCLPQFELFVGGRSGRGAIDDNVRLSTFIYNNLDSITKIFPTLDTHFAMQIFHQIFWVDANGNHPSPGSILLYADIESGKWTVNPAVVKDVAGGDIIGLRRYAIHYAKTLSDGGRYPLIIWPYHGMLGGIGHALVTIIEETLFFHNVCRNSQTGYEIKGDSFWTENYSIFQPEVLFDQYENPIAGAKTNTKFFDILLNYDVIGIAGQAKSHCVAWSIDDFLTKILARDPNLAKKVYLLEDCTSSVVIPGVMDFTEQGDEAFKKFAAAGMHIVNSTMPISTWPGVTI